MWGMGDGEWDMGYGIWDMGKFEKEIIYTLLINGIIPFYIVINYILGELTSPLSFSLSELPTLVLCIIR